MSHEEEFDNLFRQRFDERNMPVDKENWNDASKMLDAHFKKKKRRLIALWFSGIGIFLFIGLFWMYNTYSPKKSADKTSNEVAEKIQNGEPSKIINENVNRAAKRIDDKAQSNNENKNNEAGTILASNVEKKGSTKPTGNKSKTKPITDISINRSVNMNSAETNGLDVNNLMMKDSIDAQKTQPDKMVSKDNGFAKEIAIQSDAQLMQQQSDSNTKSNDASETIITKASIDSVSKSAENITIPTKMKSNISVGILWGTSVSNSFKSETNNKNEWAINGTGEIYLNCKMKERLYAEFGIMYFEKSKVNRAKNFTSYYFSNPQNFKNQFGSNIESTSIFTKRLQYFSLPLLIKYQIRNNQFFEAGVACNYLINTRSNVTNINIQNDVLLAEESTTESGYKNGFNKVDFSLIAGYNICVYKNVFAFTRFNFGLTDITKNNYYESNNNDNTSNIQFGIRAQLLNFK